jgi:hypothetical protein
MLETNGIRRRPSGAGIPLQESTGLWVHENQQILTITDWEQETRFPKMREFLREVGIASTCTLPLAGTDRKLGVIEFGSSHPDAYPALRLREQIFAAIHDLALPITQVQFVTDEQVPELCGTLNV